MDAASKLHVMAPNAELSRKRQANGNLRLNAQVKRPKLQTYRPQPLTQGSEKALSKDGDLDVSAFIKAREFEIRALEDNMAQSKKFNASRAFQSVPRELRRRTASHKPRRTKLTRRKSARASSSSRPTPSSASRSSLWARMSGRRWYCASSDT